jgi:Cys-tRNA(Pro)/Cys-tRNA(Cys) deacylase
MPGAVRNPWLATPAWDCDSLKFVATKTNAVRLLEQMGIRFDLREYEFDPADLSAGTVASKIGLPPEQVFKTLVARGDRNGVCLAVIPANTTLDLKALARATGDRNTDIVPLADVLPLTGYIRGGVTALGCKKAYPVWVDETAQLFDVISVSAGTRGLQILLHPDDYLRAAGGAYAELAR